MGSQSLHIARMVEFNGASITGRWYIVLKDRKRQNLAVLQYLQQIVCMHSFIGKSQSDTPKFTQLALLVLRVHVVLDVLFSLYTYTAVPVGAGSAAPLSFVKTAWRALTFAYTTSTVYR